MENGQLRANFTKTEALPNGNYLSSINRNKSILVIKTEPHISRKTVKPAHKIYNILIQKHIAQNKYFSFHTLNKF